MMRSVELYVLTIKSKLLHFVIADTSLLLSSQEVTSLFHSCMMTLSINILVLLVEALP